jgi:hypothetical protein
MIIGLLQRVYVLLYNAFGITSFKHSIWYFAFSRPIIITSLYGRHNFNITFQQKARASTAPKIMEKKENI